MKKLIKKMLKCLKLEIWKDEKMNLPMGCIIHVEYGRACIQADSMELITVSASQTGKRREITIFYGFFHFNYAFWNNFLWESKT